MPGTLTKIVSHFTRFSH